VAILVVLVILNVLAVKHRERLMTYIKQVFKKDPVWGTSIYLVLGVLTTLFLVPITPFNILAIYLYSPWNAYFVAMLMHVISAAAAFYITKEYKPKVLADKLHEYELFKLLENGKDISTTEWLTLVTLTRLSPNFPFALVSYMWGFTNVPFSVFIIGTVLGATLPLLLELYVIYNVGEVIEGHHGKTIIGGIVLTVLITLTIRYIVDRIIEEKKKKLKDNKIVN
jgi:uncharacterized membrane protein YdjX (TVP38/TMEM64 family)